MEIIADLHVHTKYARATSKNLDLFDLAKWSNIKGVNVVACGDFTHPKQFTDIQDNLVADGTGLFDLRDDKSGVKFFLSTEVSCIYRHKDATRRLHLCLFAPSIEAVANFNQALIDRGCKLASDGRPILGMSSKDVLQIALDTDPRMVMVPAHIWTPWFALFGSKSGYDSVGDCFEDLTPHIFALETGLSSDPAMNWAWSALDKYTLISNSDAHSGPNIGREANVFELDQLSYDNIISAIKNKNPKEFLYTIEFFPEEGMYHYDGHRLCNISLSPEETRKLKNICPVCKKPLTVGVLHRVDNLKDRQFGQLSAGTIPFKKIIPLSQIIANYFGQGRGSGKVEAMFNLIIKKFGNEFAVLLDTPLEELTALIPEALARGIIRVREQKVVLHPGYDGVYGTIELFSAAEQRASKQSKLF
ncbi:MAG: endonuclease Q family protein [Candidatus Komeilibacteria bacterium]